MTLEHGSPPHHDEFRKIQLADTPCRHQDNGEFLEPVFSTEIDASSVNSSAADAHSRGNVSCVRRYNHALTSG